MSGSRVHYITGQIIDGAMKVHSALGPGLLESAYKACLLVELRSRGLHVEVEVPLSVTYKGHRVDVAYRMDFLVERLVITELKAVTQIHPKHEAQTLSHLKLSGRPAALMINFHERHLRDGITRFVNGPQP